MNSKIYGYSKEKEYALKSIKNNSLSHFYIISGEKGCGKKLFTSFFVQAILCENNNACGNCLACMKYESGNSADIIKIKGTNKASIGAADIREQVESLYIRPIDSEYKIYIIEEGESLTVEASNALLKIFEEPPAYAIFFLLTDNRDALLDTIVSRATNIYLSPLDYDILSKYIVDELRIYDEDKIKFLRNYSFGNIGRLIEISTNEGFFALRDEVISSMESIAASEAKAISDISHILDKNKDMADEIIALMLSLIRDVLIYRTCGNGAQFINSDRMHVIRALARSFDEPLELYNGIIDTIKFKNRSIKPELAMKLAYMNTLQ